MAESHTPMAKDSLNALYNELRRVAGVVFRGARSSLTIQPTDLAHEYVLKFLEALPNPHDRTPEAAVEFATASYPKMRYMLLDYIRKHCRQRRHRVSLTLVDGDGLGFDVPDIDLFSDALEHLSHVNPNLAAVLQFRYFNDLTLQETALALGVSHATVERHQRQALDWIRNRVVCEGENRGIDE